MMGLKRRKISLFETHRARNGGADDSFIDPNTVNLDIPSGSDTDLESESEEVAQRYLKNMKDDSNRPVETVFEKGIDVWRSMGGAIHADPNDERKKQLREKEIWGENGEDAAGMRVGKAEGAKEKRNCSRIEKGTADTND